MALETWQFDNLTLSSSQYKIASYDGLDDTAAVNGSNSEVPFRSGVVWNKKSYGAAKRTLVITVLDTGGATQDARRATVDTGLDALTKLFGQRHRLITITRTLSGGGVRVGYAEVTEPIQPTQFGVEKAQFTVGLTFPQPFWEDNSNQTYNSPVPAVTATTYTPSEFSAATAPMEDLTVTITGPATNPRITDVATGFYFQYNGTVSASQTMIVNSSAWTVTGTGGFTPNMALFVHTGPRLFTLTPDYINGAQVQMTFTGGSAATKFVIVGRRRYLR